MRRYISILLLLAFTLSASDWPQFRGPDGDGHSDEAQLPETWNERENVRWKIALPGSGWSSPVVAGNEIWLTTATDNNRSLRAVSIDADSGKIRVNVEIFRLSSPTEGHSKNSGASPTPIIEGNAVYLHFGSYGTARIGRDGAIVWRNQELKFAQVHGPGGSPVLFENLLILNCDGNDTQFVAAIDKDTGKVAWRKSRPSAMAYATPLAVQTSQGPQVISPGAHRAFSYDPRTGAELWSVRYGQGFSNVPRPVFGFGLAFLCTGFYGPKLLAVRVDGKGDVTSTHIAWQYERGVPLTPSPLLAGEELYMISDNGILTCLDARTGKENWRQRLSGSYSASPVLAGGRVYILSEEGETTVVASGKQFRRIASNKLDGRFLASIAISSKALFLRSDTHLYRIDVRP
ncbi:MAG: PQQ-binding-like beta-propeller repeat protein [Bryobacteraceae bacterium]|nr:PQQ-binding-like beta-propeller repeat protein [Bryobacteraceae bacterium]